jgi:hypothetical protein
MMRSGCSVAQVVFITAAQVVLAPLLIHSASTSRWLHAMLGLTVGWSLGLCLKFGTRHAHWEASSSLHGCSCVKTL